MSYGIVTDDNLSCEEARILIFGVGGGGGNAVEHMVQNGVSSVDFVCANTDRQALNILTAPTKIQLGTGLGAGGNPAKGREAAESEEEQIRSILEGYDMVFITAGMGGGTGTGAAPVVARLAKEMEKLTVAVVTTPFEFEGGKRIKAAKEGIKELTNYVDSIITIPNEKLQDVYRNLSMRDAFKKADDVLLYGVQGIIQAIRNAGHINLDFNDVRTAMTAKGNAMMGIGRASGDSRAREATEKAIRSPLLDDLRLENAQGLIVNIAGSEIMMSEPREVAEALQSIIDLENGNIFYGVVTDDSMDSDEIQVTIIATGLSIEENPQRGDSVNAAARPPSRPASQPATSQPAQASQAQKAVAPKNITVADFLKNNVSS